MSQTTQNDKEPLIGVQTSLQDFAEQPDDKPDSVEDDQSQLSALSADKREGFELVVDVILERHAARPEEYLYLKARDIARDLPLNSSQVGTYLGEYITSHPRIEAEP
jgi:hypothetical protein